MDPLPPGVELPAGADPLAAGDEFLERMGALEAECGRLVGLGASRLQRFEPDPPMGNGWIVMADPEGNAFCPD